MNKDQRKCIFCRSSPVSLEHLFSAWISKALARSGFKGTDHQIGTSDKGTTRQWQNKQTLQYVVKAVCESCNNGWMSEIESAAAPYLEPMMLGQYSPQNPYILNEQAQRIISVWITLKSLLFWQSFKELPVLPDDWYASIYRQKNVPDNWTIVLGAYQGLIPPFLEMTPEISHVDMGSNVVHQGLLTTCGIGHLVFKIYAFQDAGAAIVHPSSSPTIQIHPISSSSISWPSRDVMDNTSLAFFFEEGGSGSESHIRYVLKDR